MLEVAHVAARFGNGLEIWKFVSTNTVGFYRVLVPLRFDQSEQLARRDRAKAALEALESGRTLRSWISRAWACAPRERIRP